MRARGARSTSASSLFVATRRPRRRTRVLLGLAALLCGATLAHLVSVLSTPTRGSTEAARWGRPRGISPAEPPARLAHLSSDVDAQTPPAESASTRIDRPTGERSTIDDDTPPLELSDARIEALVADLADDDVRGNAGRALRLLARAGASAAPALERALGSGDRQQRQYAAQLLRRLDQPPSAGLVAATVEGLADDSLDYVSNAKAGTLYLLEHAEAARDELVRGLGSEDGQQRFLCAYVLAKSGCQRDVHLVCDVLVRHLRDNRIPGDAMMSANGLLGLGLSARPYLMHAEPEADRQALQLLRLVDLDILDPPSTSRELAARGRMHDVTRVYHDPAVELDLERSDVFGWSPGMSRRAARWGRERNARFSARR